MRGWINEQAKGEGGSRKGWVKGGCRPCAVAGEGGEGWALGFEGRRVRVGVERRVGVEELGGEVGVGSGRSGFSRRLPPLRVGRYVYIYIYIYGTPPPSYPHLFCLFCVFLVLALRISFFRS